MKITACNLRSIGKEQSIDVFDKIVLCGKNGAGKSTMAKVPYFVLTGKGLSLKNNTSEGYGQIEFSGITIMRQKKQNGSIIRVNGKVCSETAMYEHLNKIGYNPDVLCALFDTETTLDGETMLKVAAMKLDVDKVLTFTSLSDENKALVKNYFAGAEVEVVTIPAINKAYNKFYSMRTDNNREVKRLRTLVAEDEPFAKVQDIDVAQLVAETNRLDAKKEKLIRDVAVSEASNEKRSRLLKSIKAWETEKLLLLAKKCTFTQMDIDDVEAKIVVHNEEIANIDSTIIALGNEIVALTQEMTSIKVRKGEILTLVSQKKKIVDTLINTKVCPLYAGVSCTTNMSVVIQEVSDEVAILEKELAEIEKTLSDMTAELDNKTQLRDDARNNILEKKKSIEELNKKSKTIRDEIAGFSLIEGKVSGIDANIKKANDELASTPEVDVEEIKAEVASVVSELTAIKKSIVDASRISDAEKRLTENKNALAAAEDRSEKYSCIISELKMLPNRIFEKIIAPIEAGLNQIMADLKSDWKIVFNFDGNGIDIFIVTSNGNINITELSTGERIVVNYVFKALICKLIHFDTIVLDNTDALDVVNYSMVENVVANSAYNTLLINCGDITSQFNIVKI